MLSVRTFHQRDILSLQGSDQGTIAIPREWTDKADVDPFHLPNTPLPILTFLHLQQLADLMANLNSVDSITGR